MDSRNVVWGARGSRFESYYTDHLIDIFGIIFILAGVFIAYAAIQIIASSF
jgi:hypothetical protein